MATPPTSTPCRRRRTLRRPRHDRRNRRVLRRRLHRGADRAARGLVPTVGCRPRDGRRRLPRHRLAVAGSTDAGRTGSPSKNGARIEKAARDDAGRQPPAVAHPVAWIGVARDAGALAAAVANPISSAPSPGCRRQAGRSRRIMLGAVAYAFPARGDVVDRRLRLRRDDPGHLELPLLRFEGCARHDSNVRPLPPQGTPPTTPDDARTRQATPLHGIRAVRQRIAATLREADFRRLGH